MPSVVGASSLSFSLRSCCGDGDEQLEHRSLSRDGREASLASTTASCPPRMEVRLALKLKFAFDMNTSSVPSDPEWLDSINDASVELSEVCQSFDSGTAEGLFMTESWLA